MQQSSITLEPQGVTGSPAYGRVGLTVDNSSPQVFSGENGFKDPKAKIATVAANGLREGTRSSFNF